MTSRSHSLQAFGFASKEAGNDNSRFGLWPEHYDGSIVRAEKVIYARPQEIPLQLAETFNALRANQTPAQLVTVRKAGVREARDGSHLDHFLIPAETRVQIVGMTI